MVMSYSDSPSLTLTNAATTLIINTDDLSSQAATIQGYTETIPCIPTTYLATDYEWAATITLFPGEYLPTPICGQALSVLETRPCLTEYNCHSPTVWLAGGATAATINVATLSAFAPGSASRNGSSVMGNYSTSVLSSLSSSSAPGRTFGTIGTTSAGLTSTSSGSAEESAASASATASGNDAAVRMRVGGSVAGVLGLVAGVVLL